MKELDEKSKYFTFGILGGFIIIFIVLLIAFITPFAVSNNEIAIIPIHGEISYINDSDNTVPSEFEVLLNKAEEDNNIKAVILDIDSSGGSLLASQEIESFVSNSSKPIIAWISGSGSTYSYLIASSADEIVANPNAVIGSNGFSYLSADLTDYYYKLGVNANTSEGNTFNTIFPNFNSLSKSQRNSINNMLYIDCKYFISEVKDNRDINISLVNFENGNIYSSNLALNSGLIDYIGDKSVALEVAANISNLTSYSVIDVNSNGFFDDFMDLITK